ncbi:MAG: homoserine dehydrogenase [Gammaproteobacteria bacterium]|nr:homoserine dehydrogenase [Gammaproteobacteria bacterium]
MNKPSGRKINIGICGLGTVGGGTLALLNENEAEITQRVGASLCVSHIASRSLNQDEVIGIPQSGKDPFAVVNDPNVEILIETMGGYEPAFDVIKNALLNGKHVVTANKALIAERGNELFEIAESEGAVLAFESSVAGGIPIIKALREGLAANKINWLAGIINGTGNFIMTEMASKQCRFEEVLNQAQALGYAEADPTFDIEGIDAAHKLTILSSIAFGIPLRFDGTYTEGISTITPEDIRYSDELGYCIKHLGIARRSKKGIEMRVHPTLIPRSRLLANVDGVGNAVLVHGNSVGATLYSGPGAGAEATASAVVADLIDLARHSIAGADKPVYPPLGYKQMLDDIEIVDIEDIEAEYYLRIPAMDRVGVMANISSILQSYGISIEAVIQKEAISKIVPIIILTHRAEERKLNLAIKAIESLDDVAEKINRIRVEPFDETEL